MKFFKILLVVVLATIPFTGCTTTSGGVAKEIVVGIISDAAVIVLQNNPESVPVLVAIQSTLDGILTGQPLTQELVMTYLERIDTSKRLTPASKVLLKRAILRTFNLLSAEVKLPVLSIDNERVRTVLIRINQELKLAIDDAHALAT